MADEGLWRRGALEWLGSGVTGVMGCSMVRRKSTSSSACGPMGCGRGRGARDGRGRGQDGTKKGKGALSTGTGASRRSVGCRAATRARACAWESPTYLWARFAPAVSDRVRGGCARFSFHRLLAMPTGERDPRRGLTRRLAQRRLRQPCFLIPAGRGGRAPRASMGGWPLEASSSARHGTTRATKLDLVGAVLQRPQSFSSIHPAHSPHLVWLCFAVIFGSSTST